MTPEQEERIRYFAERGHWKGAGVPVNAPSLAKTLLAEIDALRAQNAELLEACKARLRHGHNDTCSLVHSWPECSCGHHALVDAIAKATGEKGE
jgi:hypothetical protein